MARSAKKSVIEFPRKAPCGCISGRFLCQEADILWNAVLELGRGRKIKEAEEMHEQLKQHYRDQGL